MANFVSQKSKVQSNNFMETTEEAICFGWIDSLGKKKDVEFTI